MTGYYWAYAAMFGLILLLCGGLFGLEVYAVWFRPAGDDTISEMTGYLFRAATRDGYHALVTFMAAGLALAGFLLLWYPKHVRDLALSKKATADRRKARPVALIAVQEGRVQIPTDGLLIIEGADISRRTDDAHDS